MNKYLSFILLLLFVFSLPLSAKVKTKKDPLTGILVASNPIGSQSFAGTKFPKIKTSVEVTYEGDMLQKIALVFMMDDHYGEMGEGSELMGENKFSSPLRRVKLEDAAGINTFNAVMNGSTRLLVKEYYEAVITEQDLINIIDALKSKKEVLFRIVLKDQRQVDLKFKKTKPFEEILSHIENLKH